jgi:hypothetical protein
MTNERRSSRRYDLSLPVIIRVPLEKEASSRKGKTRDISTRGIYFTVDQDLSVGAEVDLTITVPAEGTGGKEVFLRAKGKVLRLEKTPESGFPQVGVAAVIELFEIIRNAPDNL